MKLLKQDKDYKYYSLNSDDLEKYKFSFYDVIAISKNLLEKMNAKDCLNCGYIYGCDYKLKDITIKGDLKKRIIDTNTIIIID